ncbi:hypothetical protein MJD09_27055, partial [bacterium]|nr:hypothetical protein [bacterium]
NVIEQDVSETTVNDTHDTEFSMTLGSAVTFKILEKLGEGGMRWCTKPAIPKLERTVAIKLPAAPDCSQR